MSGNGRFWPQEGQKLKIAAGYELIYQLPQPTPMMLMLNIHSSRVADLVVPDLMTTDPVVPI